MTDRASRSYLVIAAAIIIVGVLISASLFIAISKAPKTTAVTTVYCTQSGPVSSVSVQFVNDSSKKPMSGVTIGGSFQPNCQGDLPFPIQAATTQSNGTLPLSIGANALGECGCSIGIYDLTMQYSGRLYNLTLNPPIEHLAQEVVYTIGLPSGVVLGTQITDFVECTSGTGPNATTFTC